MGDKEAIALVCRTRDNRRQAVQAQLAGRTSTRKAPNGKAKIDGALAAMSEEDLESLLAKLEGRRGDGEG